MLKQEFCLTNYEFKVIKMDAFNQSRNEKFNMLTYYLLVDANNFIHDYKFKFHQIYITQETSKSHDKNKITKYLHKRIEILRLLNIKHSYRNDKEPKNQIFINDIDILNKLNKWILHEDWTEITFQSIEYILRGSNPGGQGNGSGYLKTLYHDLPYCFGFFFQELNIKKELQRTYTNISYKQIWEEYFDNNNIQEINFNNWIEEANIANYFKEFVNNSKNWKDIKERFREDLKKSKQAFSKLESRISSLRNKYKTAIDERFEKFNTLEIINYFFKDSNSTRYERAHIKPVHQIRREYIATENEKILEQIADPNNFLPLSPNAHTLYDNKYFYWSLNGKLVGIKKYTYNDIIGFDQINPQAILEIRKYLEEYNSLIKNWSDISH